MSREIKSKNLPIALVTIAAATLVPACSGKLSLDRLFSVRHVSVTKAPAQPSARDVALVKEHLNYPALTVLLAVNDVQKTAAAVTEGGGTIDYNPNRTGGSSIPFLVADLPPTKIIDPDFIAKLNLKAIDVEAPEKARKLMAQTEQENTSLSQQLYIPTQDVNVPQLRAIDPGKGLGEKTVVAIIDTGVDASHPVFQDRVIYWEDDTQEGRFKLSPANVAQGKIAAKGYENVQLPAQIQGNATVYVGAIDEGALSTQLSDADKTAGKKGVDLNRNGTLTDRFAVLVGKDSASGEWVAYVDTDGDGTFDKTELATPFMDFNDARATKRQGGTAPFADLLRFPSETATIAYPLIFGMDDQGAPEYLTVGFDGIDHGTHVGGIIGANGATSGPAGLVGAAPNVEIMALKICSGLTCTDQAMLRALIGAFYNPKGYIPDVVNMSIGELQDNSESVMDYLFCDLADKFGATFVIANGNDGPAYRTGNSTGAFAPTIMVGAYVSKNTLTKMYSDDPGAADVPNDSLHYFTSLGPSFTGELRPNIVAPGSALSSIPLTDGGSEMMNGTSMATPMTTGSIAAMISLARSEGLLTSMDALRAAKAKVVRAGAGSAPGSLIGIPLTIRGALEDSARTFPGYTMPQEGFGLVQIDRAYEQLKSTLGQIGPNSTSGPAFQLSINGDAATNRLYDRAYNTAAAKPVLLGLRDDGELTDTDRLNIETTPIIVKLQKVEVQSSDGTVVDAQSPLPFAVGLANGEAPDPTTTSLTLSNTVRQGFYSIRHPEMMQPNHTYIAQYDLTQNGVRVGTLVDVVHRPLMLGDNATTFTVPGIKPGAQTLQAAYGIAGVAIPPNTDHRYFVDVASRDSGMKIGLGFSQAAQGTLIYQVNDPNGVLIGQGTIGNLPALGSVHATAVASVPVSTNPDGTTLTGIYEITIANGSIHGLIPTQYDFEVQMIRFVSSASHVELSTQGAAGSKAATESPAAVITLENSSREVSAKDLQLELSPYTLMESLKPFPVVPTTTTLKLIHVPPVDSTGTTATVSVDYGINDQGDNSESRIDNHLYVMQNGTAVVAYSADATASTGTAKVFRGVKRPDPANAAPTDELYAGVETFMVEPAPVPSGAGAPAPKKGLDSIDVEVTYDVPAATTNDGGALLDNGKSNANVYLVDLLAPKSITNVPVGIQQKYGPKARAILKVGTPDPAFQIAVPVTLEQ